MVRVRALLLLAACALLALAMAAPAAAVADSSLVLSSAFTTAELVDQIEMDQPAMLEVTADADAEAEVDAEAEAEVDAEAEAEAELDAELDAETETETETAPLLADGVWRHEPLEARSMIQHSSTATQAKHYPDGKKKRRADDDTRIE